MVRKRLYDADQSQKAKLEVQSRQIIKKIEKKLLNVNSCHFMPLKWALHVIHEARERQEIDERLVNVLINEVNALHTACDRLINLRHETFAWGLTKGVMTSIYTFFVVGSVSTRIHSKIQDNQRNHIHSTDTPALEWNQRWAVAGHNFGVFIVFFCNVSVFPRDLPMCRAGLFHRMVSSRKMPFHLILIAIFRSFSLIMRNTTFSSLTGYWTKSLKLLHSCLTEIVIWEIKSKIKICFHKKYFFISVQQLDSLFKAGKWKFSVKVVSSFDSIHSSLFPRMFDISRVTLVQISIKCWLLCNSRIFLTNSWMNQLPFSKEVRAINIKTKALIVQITSITCSQQKSSD